MHSCSVVSVAVCLLVGALARPPAALAHAFLDHAEPRVGSTVRGSPAAVRLTFTEPVEKDFSRVEVLDAHERPVAAGQLEHPDPRELRVTLPALPPGDYTVHWAVTSVDTHQTEGRFDFSVTAP
jgi:methionine-rich copper-binding protein CopC